MPSTVYTHHFCTQHSGTAARQHPWPERSCVHRQKQGQRSTGAQPHSLTCCNPLKRRVGKTGLPCTGAGSPSPTGSPQPGASRVTPQKHAFSTSNIPIGEIHPGSVVLRRFTRSSPLPTELPSHNPSTLTLLTRTAGPAQTAFRGCCVSSGGAEGHRGTDGWQPCIKTKHRTRSARHEAPAGGATGGLCRQPRFVNTH